jgi:hypothetical protein
LYSIANILCIVASIVAVPVIDWITKTTKERKPDPPKPEDFLAVDGLRGNATRYTEFADRMIRAVNGKSRYDPSSSTTLLDDLVPPSQEAFALLLYKNGYENWLWMHNHACMTSDGSDVTVGENDEVGCPSYKYTRRRGDLTSRNGGWTREGMDLFNELYRKVRADRLNDNGAFAKVYREHKARLLIGKKRKRGCTTRQEAVAVSNDLEELWEAAAVTTGATASV